MSEKNLETLLCKHTDSIIDAMSKIDSNGNYIVFNVDDDGKLIGSLTDGDIRRWIIKGGSLDAKVYEAAFKDVRFVKKEGTIEETRHEAERQFVNSDKRVIPVVDDEHKVVDIIILKQGVDVVDNNSIKGIPVIIMAGGKGTRLQPYTKVLPKPLIPMNDIPIVERIMNRFHSFGASDFFMTLNYRKEMIKAYFNDSKHEYNLVYVEEDKPLGTAGSIRLINQKFNSPVIVSNCDILIDADYGEILKYHKINNNMMTIVSSAKKITVPYGVLNTVAGGKVTSIEEKPNMSYFVNTGMYIIDPDVIEFIPEDSYFHMTDLTQTLLDKEMKVGTYPISEEAFLDMGEMEEMKRMEEKLLLE